jgi:hypothetical protein
MSTLDPKQLELLRARSSMHKAWARANEASAEFYEVDGRPDDAREAKKAAAEEWREAAKLDKEARLLVERIERIERAIAEMERIERAGGAA